MQSIQNTRGKTNDPNAAVAVLDTIRFLPHPISETIIRRYRRSVTVYRRKSGQLDKASDWLILILCTTLYGKIQIELQNFSEISMQYKQIKTAISSIQHTRSIDYYPINVRGRPQKNGRNVKYS